MCLTDCPSWTGLDVWDSCKRSAETRRCNFQLLVWNAAKRAIMEKNLVPTSVQLLTSIFGNIGHRGTAGGGRIDIFYCTGADCG